MTKKHLLTPLRAGATAAALALGLSVAPAQAAECTVAANQQAEGFAQPPEDAEAVVTMEHALFLISRVVNYLNQNCGADPDFQTQMSTYQQLYSSTMETCRAVSSTGQCSEHQYGT